MASAEQPLAVAFEAGAGRPVVLIHGWGSSGLVWADVGQRLATRFHVLAPDLPGFGASPPPADPASPDHAAAIAAFLDARALQSVVLVGWSLGGLIALEYVDRFGTDRLSGLAIVDVSPRAREADDWPIGLAVGEGFAGGLARWLELWSSDRDAVIAEHSRLAFGGRADPGLIDLLVREGARADPSTALGTLVTYAERDYRPVLTRVDVPTLLVFGGRSESTTRWVADYMERAIPDATVVRVEEAGHAVMLETPDAFAAALSEFAWTLSD